ncbi:thioredoxin family protein [Methanotorris igneus]|uniref:Thioredoxin domain-containing protein n=1 Tax=Methanotorris igneus (strain DSM 5666 / JCM 11834 / Kol 5) TaxID=880724 RepID=F6BCM9_METIK|nr:thioredoxin family protein [Methanotorris igneus]AEF96240.1 Thioredoxin domain-containing protein [Methanotorris igneus Kol 5]
MNLKIFLFPILILGLSVPFSGCVEDSSVNNGGIGINEGRSDFNGTCVVEFYADWCIYCKKLEPVLDELEKEGIKVVRINVDENKELASKYGVRYLPTVFYVEDGKIVDKTIGYNPEEIKEKAKQLK